MKSSGTLLQLIWIYSELKYLIVLIHCFYLRQIQKKCLQHNTLFLIRFLYSNFVVQILITFMYLKHTNFFRSSKFYHPCKYELNPEYVSRQACKLAAFVNCYRHYGHFFAKLDPLNLYNRSKEQFYRPVDLQIPYSQSLKNYKFSSFLTKTSTSIEDLENKLKATYLSDTGVQFQHLTSYEEKQFLYNEFEALKSAQIPSQLKVSMAKTLIQAESLDHFIHKKWTSFKRYSGEGAESTIVALNQLFSLAANSQIEHIVLGMPHRGRFNLLVNILNYQFKYLCRKISGKTDTPHDLRNIIDDVTSHIAHSTTKKYGQKQVNVSLIHNPSHLQAQNPVSMGKVRSKQQIYGKDKVLNVQVHGDSAVCAQGIIMESLCLAKTPNYQINGSIHIITNNQLGYTTRPIDSRPSKYATDVFKAYDIPILHVNGENIEDIHRAVKLAVDYRNKYKKDILIDIICYRKYGHNQVDEPQFTQPLMYKNIRKAHQANPKKYAKNLEENRLIDSSFYDSVRQNKFQQYEKEFLQSQKISKIDFTHYSDSKNAGSARAFTHQWSHFKPSQFGSQQKTGFDLALLKEFAKASCFSPPNFEVHSRIRKFHVQKRLKLIEENKLDWATCQALALFSLNFQGTNIRFTGQDVERGTFSQRHLNFVDQKTQTTFNPLQFFSQQSSGRGNVEIYNSPLSENAVMSYEYGYSLDHPNNLAIWQAQFGDFFNTAQVVVDVFLTNSQNKWLRQSSLALILPHGYDNMGPEHSSCRIERFLQSANTDGSLRYLNLKPYQSLSSALDIRDQHFFENIYDANFSFAYPTTPANMFHLLRRQMKRNFRKPVVIAGPKTLLRHPDCISHFQDLGPETEFLPIIPYHNQQNLQNCQVLFLTSGKYVYDIKNILKQKNSLKTSLFAIEELFPFPEQKLQEHLKKISISAKVYWIQEENFNSGPYQFVENRVNRVLKRVGCQNEVKFIGRRASSATAVGSVQLHKADAEALKQRVSQLII